MGIHVKICGVTNLADAKVAIEAGADLLGFNFYIRSPRCVAPEEVKEILKGIGDWRLEIGRNPQSSILNLPKTVGVFVNESAARVAEILDFTGLDLAQLHGDESPEMVARLFGRAFKALRPADNAAAEAEARRFAPLGPREGPCLLVDAYDPAAYGGTGKKADWHVAAQLARRYPGLLLAGGLTPANVAQAVSAVRPWGVDVSSGVEVEPGRKDHDALRRFVTIARR
jgi:phosphoribosylanthranilate isomerase